MTEHAADHRSRRGPEREVTVGGWTVDRYVAILKWPVVITWSLSMVVTAAGWDPMLVWLLLILLTIGLGIATVQQGGKIGNAATLGLAAGLVVGLFTSIFRFVWFRTLTAFLQIITESLLAVLVGSLMSASAFLVRTERARSAVGHQQRKR